MRRPSLVDSETFNTHSAATPATAQSPTFPAQLPAGPVRFLGATPNEFYDLPVNFPFEEKPLSLILTGAPSIRTGQLTFISMLSILYDPKINITARNQTSTTMGTLLTNVVQCGLFTWIILARFVLASSKTYYTTHKVS